MCLAHWLVEIKFVVFFAWFKPKVNHFLYALAFARFGASLGRSCVGLLRCLTCPFGGAADNRPLARLLRRGAADLAGFCREVPPPLFNVRLRASTLCVECPYDTCCNR